MMCLRAGLLRLMQTEDELAAVLAHEVRGKASPLLGGRFSSAGAIKQITTAESNADLGCSSLEHPST